MAVYCLRSTFCRTVVYMYNFGLAVIQNLLSYDRSLLFTQFCTCIPCIDYICALLACSSDILHIVVLLAVKHSVIDNLLQLLLPRFSVCCQALLSLMFTYSLRTIAHLWAQFCCSLLWYFRAFLMWNKHEIDKLCHLKTLHFVKSKNQWGACDRTSYWIKIILQTFKDHKIQTLRLV